MGDTKEVYRTLHPPTMETIVVSRGEGFIVLEIYDDGERIAHRVLGRNELARLAKEGT